jgi:protein-disulfide isomerase
MTSMTRRPMILATLAVAVLAVAALLIVPRLGRASAEGTDLRLAEQPRKGPADAPVEVVVFEDFLCPHCGTFAERVAPRLERTYVEDGDVAYYMLNFVVIGPESERIAQVGECVLDQGNDAYWAFETAAYRSQQGLDEARAIELALEYAPGLDEERLRTCAAQDERLEAVRADGETAQQLGLRGTPSVLVDGEQVDPTFDAISSAIETALAERR